MTARILPFPRRRALDPRRPARGILLGLTLGATCWCCAIGGSVWL
jgi:hypothetical protein